MCAWLGSFVVVILSRYAWMANGRTVNMERVSRTELRLGSRQLHNTGLYEFGRTDLSPLFAVSSATPHSQIRTWRSIFTSWPMYFPLNREIVRQLVNSCKPYQRGFDSQAYIAVLRCGLKRTTIRRSIWASCLYIPEPFILQCGRWTKSSWSVPNSTYETINISFCFFLIQSCAKNDAGQ